MRRWTRTDTSRFQGGFHADLHDVLGGQLLRDGGARFRVWAPFAQEVHVVGDFNGWATGAHPAHHLDAGVWEATAPEAREGQCYKLRILGRDGVWHEKSDPFARWAEAPPATASRLLRSTHRWHDAAWRRQRDASDPWHEPVAVYEVHLGSWRRDLPGDEAIYRRIADPLVAHVTALGFTHVELMPVMEHPFGGSWGYQVTGYFAPTARWGTPDDLKYLIDRLHRAGIGVILDWVPAHFPRDAHALYRFAGEPIYEHPDPRRGEHPDWDTAIFDYGRPEVRGFLMSNAVWWLGEFHADGLRVDAVASMLYLDYSRPEGEWEPNIAGGRENLEAIAFLRDLHSELGLRFPKALVVAEESTSFPGVSRGVHEGGLGFGFKWDMGWMNDSLRHLARDPLFRGHHHDELTFRSIYQFSERFVLPLSHDEVVHGKGSLYGKMPGDPWQKVANLRLLLALQWAHTGKKLVFMGTELGSAREWDHDGELDWGVGEQPGHAGLPLLITALNHLYRSEPALHTGDHEPDGFRWIAGDDVQRSVMCWLRVAHRDEHAEGDTAPAMVLVVVSTTPAVHRDYRIGVPLPGAWATLLSTDDARYGGSGVCPPPTVATTPERWHGHPQSLVLDLPPLGVLLLRSPA